MYRFLKEHALVPAPEGVYLCTISWRYLSIYPLLKVYTCVPAPEGTYLRTCLPSPEGTCTCTCLCTCYLRYMSMYRKVTRLFVKKYSTHQRGIYKKHTQSTCTVYVQCTCICTWYVYLYISGSTKIPYRQRNSSSSGLQWQWWIQPTDLGKESSAYNI